MGATNPQADACLAYITSCIRLRDHSAPFEPLIKRWFAFSRNGRPTAVETQPNWCVPSSWPARFGAPDFAQFTSTGACAAIASSSRDQLLVEPAIPYGALRRRLFSHQPEEAREVRALLLRFFRLGLITYRERHALEAAGVSSRMPRGWHEGQNLFERFEFAGVSVQEAAKLGWSVRQQPTRVRRWREAVQVLRTSTSAGAYSGCTP